MIYSFNIQIETDNLKDQLIQLETDRKTQEQQIKVRIPYHWYTSTYMLGCRCSYCNKRHFISCTLLTRQSTSVIKISAMHVV